MGNTISDAKGYKRLSSRLKQAREDAGLTQKQAAASLNKPQWFVSRSETGTRRVDVIELGQFAQVYGKPLSYFIEGIVDGLVVNRR